ncbi:beta-galactosidase 17 [Senna tora]|uniref:Beta-galactosidase 17 n=1 Tax=Senna tora TaxID=362788 RepID=A0A835CFK0_9FABA|nr:beta-galactosidase 17 [Senna tora]
MKIERGLGGFPTWLLALNPSLNLRSFDPSFLQLVKTIYHFYAKGKVDRGRASEVP